MFICLLGFICRIGEIRDVTVDGYRLHFRYHLHGVVRVNSEYAKSKEEDLAGREKLLWRELVAHWRWENRDRLCSCRHCSAACLSVFWLLQICCGCMGGYSEMSV